MTRKRLLIRALSLLLLMVVAIIVCGALLRRQLAAKAVEKIERRLGVELSFSDIDLDHAGIVMRGVRFALPGYPALQGKADRVGIDAFEQAVRVSGGRIDVGQQRLSFLGEFALRGQSGELALGLPPASCQELLDASPAFVQQRMQGVTLRGMMGFELDLVVDEAHPEKTVLSVELEEGCEVDDFGSLPTPDVFRTPFIHRVYSEDGEVLELLAGPGTQRWANLGDISPFIVESVVQAEDPLFWQHNGILLSRIRVALAENLRHGRLRYGASTITMQLAKNLFLSREKTISRKILEALFTWYLERYFTKAEILELYLNVVEFGPSIYGVSQAAEYYFGRGPGDINLTEAIFLTKLLPAPVERHAKWKSGGLSESMRRRAGWLLRSLAESRKITEDEYHEALTEPLMFHRPGNECPQPRSQAIRTKTLLSGVHEIRRLGIPKLSGPRAPVDLLKGEREELLSMQLNP